jgi:hypothetical protein
MYPADILWVFYAEKDLLIIVQDPDPKLFGLKDPDPDPDPSLFTPN